MANQKISLTGPTVRASDEINQYLMRMPGFLTIKDLEASVWAFKNLRPKDKAVVIKHLHQRSSVNTYEAKRTATGMVETLFRHVKHPVTESIPGYIYPLVEDKRPPAPPSIPAPVTPLSQEIARAVNPAPLAGMKMCEGCGHEKNDYQFSPKPDGGLIDTCNACVDRLMAETQRSIIEKSKENEQMASLQTQSQTPAEIRRIAAEMLRQADEAEKNAGARDALNKQLTPLRAEVIRAFGVVNGRFEEMIDAMADLEKAVVKLRDFKVV